VIEVRYRLIPLVLLSITLLLSGGLGVALAMPDDPGDGLQNGDLDRDRDRDQDRTKDQDGDCPAPSDGEDGGDPNQGDGKRNRFGPLEGQDPKLAMHHWALEWQYLYQYRWDPKPP
jgi:hypothetical protein